MNHRGTEVTEGITEKKTNKFFGLCVNSLCSLCLCG